MKEYFSHDYNARADRKLINLAMIHGMAGIGIYWCIIEMLYENGGTLPLEYERITFELRTDCETVKSVINDFSLFTITDSIFFSESVNFRLKIRIERSDKARESATKRWEKYERNANALPTQNERNAIKEKKRKEKKSILPATQGATLHSLAKDIFTFHYKHWVESDYPYWEAKDAGSLSALLKKIRKITEAHREETKPGSPPLTDIELLDNFDSFLTKVGLLGAEDEFILNNFSPAFLSGTFNKLVTTLRNKANGNYKERLRQTRTALRANDRAQQWGSLLQFARGSAGAK